MKKRTLKNAIHEGGVFPFSKKLAELLGFNFASISADAKSFDAGYNLSQAKILIRSDDEMRALAPNTKRVGMWPTWYKVECEKRERENANPEITRALSYLRFPDDRAKVKAVIVHGWHTLFTTHPSFCRPIAVDW